MGQTLRGWRIEVRGKTKGDGRPLRSDEGRRARDQKSEVG
jgi:hypothetical protein